MTVYEAWSRVMGDVRSVAKAQRNTAQGFQFRGIDDVTAAVSGPLRAHSVAVVPSVISHHNERVEIGRNHTLMSHVVLLVEFKVYGPDGDSFLGSAVGEAMDSGDKGFSKAHSVALRVWLLQALMLDTGTPDADASSYQLSTTLTAEINAELGSFTPPMLDKVRAARSQNGWPERIADYTPGEAADLRSLIAAVKASNDPF